MQLSCLLIAWFNDNPLIQCRATADLYKSLHLFLVKFYCSTQKSITIHVIMYNALDHNEKYLQIIWVSCKYYQWHDTLIQQVYYIKKYIITFPNICNKCKECPNYLLSLSVFFVWLKFKIVDMKKDNGATIMLPLIYLEFPLNNKKMYPVPVLRHVQRIQNSNSNLKYITCLVRLTHNQVIFLFFFFYFCKVFQTSVSSKTNRKYMI